MPVRWWLAALAFIVAVLGGFAGGWRAREARHLPTAYASPADFTFGLWEEVKDLCPREGAGWRVPTPSEVVSLCEAERRSEADCENPQQSDAGRAFWAAEAARPVYVRFPSCEPVGGSLASEVRAHMRCIR